ncbi:hypothetical protein K438DRAFT_776768 [Mycena galopus ATCC 62051]|nr:hypothetical protein K438DRAFT_776768 [Mycena galopus ATCC 62051]
MKQDSVTDMDCDTVLEKMQAARTVVHNTSEILCQIRESRRSPELSCIRQKMQEFEARWAMSQLEDIPDCRIEYWDQTLVVTYATSHTHESFNVLFESVVKIVEAVGGFHIERNAPVRSGSYKTPDMFIAKRPAGRAGAADVELSVLEPLIIIECDYMNNNDLAAKAKEYLEAEETILAVICIYIKGKYSSPKAAPRDDSNWEIDFKSSNSHRKPLTAVIAQGHKFGQIDGISATIHYRGGQRKEFKLYGSTDGQEDFTLRILLLLRKIMSMDAILALQHKQSLTIDFENFFAEVDRRLLLDAHNRYDDWIRDRLGQRGQKRPAYNLDGPPDLADETDDEVRLKALIQQEAEERKAKKPKVERGDAGN